MAEWPLPQSCAHPIWKVSLPYFSSKISALMDDLFSGVLVDSVRCLTCGLVKSRRDKFMDLPLLLREETVTPAGMGGTSARVSAGRTYGTVSAALDAFVSEEFMNGANQYQCERCDTKRDAEKRLQVSANIKSPHTIKHCVFFLQLGNVVQNFICPPSLQ